ncbi:hypothetical protein AVEN_161033-1 [Araneus ventricosus]|uniref:Uncharacterized protein n=1 Tax=Araneus ventricosus TaxID=182803 RepID=A0A4Y2HW70_ARAVE|nr:hypothetical protein AVEN_161033-1 [Araneus ventricosus]
MRFVSRVRLLVVFESTFRLIQDYILKPLLTVDGIFPQCRWLRDGMRSCSAYGSLKILLMHEISHFQNFDLGQSLSPPLLRIWKSIRKKNFGDCASRLILQWEGLWPTCKAIDTSEQVDETAAYWKCCYNIEIDMAKPTASMLLKMYHK